MSYLFFETYFNTIFRRLYPRPIDSLEDQILAYSHLIQLHQQVLQVLRQQPDQPFPNAQAVILNKITELRGSLATVFRERLDQSCQDFYDQKST